MERTLKKNMHIYVKLNNFSVHLKLTKHYKLTILQLKKKRPLKNIVPQKIKIKNIVPLGTSPAKY